MSFPFFQRELGLGGLSVLPGLRGILEVPDCNCMLVAENGELLEILIGGSGKRWLCFFTSSGRLVGDSGAVPPALGWRGETAPLCILELGPGLVIRGLGIGEHSGLPLLCCQNWPSISPPIELCPDVCPEPGLEHWPDPRKVTSGKGFAAQNALVGICSGKTPLIGLLEGLDIELSGALPKAPLRAPCITQC